MSSESYVSIKHLLSPSSAPLIEKKVEIRGWLRTRRDSKGGFSFLAINDGSCFDSIQVVANNALKNYESEILKLPTGASLKIFGKLVKSEGKGQSVEIQADQVDLIGNVEDPESYPVSKKGHTMEFLRTVAHLRPRTNTFGAVARIRHRLALAIHEYFDRHGFFWVHTPIISTSDCEGAGHMFRVSTLDFLNVKKAANGKPDFSGDFFGKEAFLTVSGQLNVEAYACALSKVYTFGPTFRAENSNTSRHLSEFWMIEPEIAFATLKEDIELAEGLLKSVFKEVLDKNADDMKFFAERIDKDCISRVETFVNQSFEVIDYTEAIKKLEGSGKKFEFPVKWGMDLQTEHERWLCEEWVKRPVVVKNYPKDIKAFYMKLNSDGKTVAAMDILAPGIGEIVGGSQREDNIETLKSRMREYKLDPEQYQWYLDLRRYGGVPHAGFGLGFERSISYVTGLSNVRDCIPYPRAPGQADF
jgi:asparaginyl-tRNA synthetase